MNIIEAIQNAEQGRLITYPRVRNWKKDRFLKYISGGVFFEYELVDGKPVYKFEVRDFTMAEVLATDWDAIEDIYFSKNEIPDKSPTY